MHDFGTEACRWGEAWALLTVALRDTDTWLAVKVHGLRYRAREEAALTNSLLLGFYADSETSAETLQAKFMPWTKAESKVSAKPEPVTAAEYEEATRAMLEEFGVPSEVYEAELSGIVAAKRQDEKTEKELEELRKALENG